MASTSASSATSHRTARALWPSEDSSSAAERTAFSFTSASTTEAPDSAKAFAVARPSPDPAPVTSATLPSKDMFMTISSFDWRVASWLVGTFCEDIFRDGQRRKDVGPADIECEMRDGLRGLRLRQPVIHRPVEMRRKLGCLSIGDQRADGDETAVPWRKIRAQPQVTEQHVGRVLHDTRKGRAKLLLDCRCPPRFGSFVERQRRYGNSRKLIGADVAGGKDILGDGNRRHRVGPAGIEGEVCDDFRNLARSDVVIEREIEMIWHLDRLIARDQGCQRHDAAVAGCKAGAPPYVAEETALRVGLQRRSDLSHVLIRQHRLRSGHGDGLLCAGRWHRHQQK